MKSIFIGVMEVAQACQPFFCRAELSRGDCIFPKAVLHCIGVGSLLSYCALTSAAVFWSCIIANLYEEQISIDVIAAAQACCEPVPQSSSEQWGSYVALTSAAVH